MGNIDGFPNYEVTREGRVIAHRFHRGSRSVELAQSDDGRGYVRVELSANGCCKKFRVHRLVAQVYIPNPNNLPQVNHKDGNKINNNAENLEWCTHDFNMKHAHKTGLVGKVLSQPLQRKMSISQVESAIAMRESGMTYGAIADALGLNWYLVRNNILGICGTGRDMPKIPTEEVSREAASKRRSIMTNEQIEESTKLRNSGMSYGEISSIVGITKATVRYNILGLGGNGKRYKEANPELIGG